MGRCFLLKDSISKQMVVYGETPRMFTKKGRHSPFEDASQRVGLLLENSYLQWWSKHQARMTLSIFVDCFVLNFQIQIIHPFKTEIHPPEAKQTLRLGQPCAGSSASQVPVHLYNIKNPKKRMPAFNHDHHVVLLGGWLREKDALHFWEDSISTGSIRP